MALTNSKKLNAPKISHFVIMGDSLSDDGRMAHRKLFGIIPMSWVSGLSKYSPKGRFTNGYAWSDDVAALMSNIFTINMLKQKYSLSSTDIADGIINRDGKVTKPVERSYNLDSPNGVKYNGMDLVRNYAEGGLTSHSYKGMPSTSPTRFFARLLLKSLSVMRYKLFADDKAHNVSQEQKKQTLVVEWSGANDLITVNAKPSRREADRAINDRIKNVEEMIKHGYKNFVLFNLPDLSLTPRYQAKSYSEQQNAHDVSEYFNRRLAEECGKLQRKYPSSSVKVFDLDKTFRKVYENPQQYGFDKDKLKTPYTKSSDFHLLANGTSPANGYMFWDDVHPSADMQEFLANEFYKKNRDSYEFVDPSNSSHISQSEPQLETPTSRFAMV